MSIRHAAQHVNPFLTVPIGQLFLSNALPMAVVMSMGGVLNVADGICVGHFIGPNALAAISLAFPVIMMLSALTTLAGGGMSSLMARHLGAGDRVAAGRMFAGAHGLIVAISLGLILLWAAVGAALISSMAASDTKLAGLAQDYLRIMILGAPAQLMLGVHADALRNEGRAGLIAALSVLVNLFNIGANWLGIVVFNLGISGSALGTVAAQALGLVLVAGVRGRSTDLLPLSVLRAQSWLKAWPQIIRLGLPLCLSFTGIAVTASVVMLSLRLHGETEYDVLVAAYGVVTRILGFAFLPQMAIALATQSIAGNNAGAGRSDRAQAALRLAMVVAFLWCFSVALVGFLAARSLGSWFSADPAVIGGVARILQPMMMFYALSGPVLVLALYCQALGQPDRTAALTLVKPWLLTPALILALSAGFGVSGTWLAFPVADAAILVLAVMIGRNILRTGGAPAVNVREKHVTIDDAKAQAKALRTALGVQGNRISHAQALELIAKQRGARDWNTLQARLALRNAHPELALGDRVRGLYLGQPFTGQIIGLSGPPSYRQISIRFDTPVDVVKFESFSNLRRQIKTTIDEHGRSHRNTSDGEPHLIVETEKMNI